MYRAAPSAVLFCSRACSATFLALSLVTGLAALAAFGSAAFNVAMITPREKGGRVTPPLEITSVLHARNDVSARHSPRGSVRRSLKNLTPTGNGRDSHLVPPSCDPLTPY